MRAVKEATCPLSASKVRSFLGGVGLSSRFVHDFATKAELLRVLCRKDEKVESLIGKRKRRLSTLKEDMAEAPMLAYFDRGAHTKVIADASP